MLKNSILTLAALLTLNAATSCKKEKKEDEVKTDTELLTERPWNARTMMEEATVNDSLIYKDLEVLNFTVDFRTDNTVVFTEPGEETETTTWTLNNKNLTIDGELFQVSRLTETELVITSQETEYDPDMGTVVYTVEVTLGR